LTVRAPGRVVVESRARRSQWRMIAAMVGAEPSGDRLLVGTVPLGWSKGKFAALVQVLASPAATTKIWELATVRSSRGEITVGANGRIDAQAPVPVALEEVVEFSAGPFEVVGLANEPTTDRALSSRVDGVWPNLEAARATVAPIALLQPLAGAFLRDDELKRQGLLVLPQGATVNPEASLAIVTLVCRSKEGPRRAVARRRLAGETRVPFGETTLELEAERCAQLRDLVPGNVLGTGRFVYEIDVDDSQGTAATSRREFDVVRR
jgi:hypothetical protein